MPDLDMLDLERLLAPISESKPCGEDLAFSSEFDRIREAQRNDDPTLDQGEWVTDLKSADWPAVLAQTSALLEGRSKDLQLAVWFTEAAVRVRGFSGFALGLRVVAGLCERYWEQMFPAMEDGDPEPRIGNLSWLAAGAPSWTAAVAIVDARQGRFSKLDFEAARRRENGSESASGERLPPLAELEQAKRQTSHDFYREALDAVADCREALAAMEAAVDARVGIDGPSFNKTREMLADVNDLLRRFAYDAGMREAGVEVMDEMPTSSDASTPTASIAAAATDGVLNSRREALAQLRRVAEFFRKTEPHSPVAYLADKAARWGEMPLHDWLKRVVKDDTTLSQLQELLDVAEEERGR
jgi:type VI secretion system protein ImpA